MLHAGLLALLIAVPSRKPAVPRAATMIELVAAPPVVRPVAPPPAQPTLVAAAAPAGARGSGRAARSVGPGHVSRNGNLRFGFEQPAGDGGGGRGGGRGIGSGLGIGDGGAGHAAMPRLARPDVAPPPPPSKARPPKLIYPKREAEAEPGEQFVARIKIDRDGYVVGARLVHRSNSPRDDDAAALIFRFRYAPALDAAGRPIDATIDQPFLVE